MIDAKTVKSIEELITEIKSDYSSWNTTTYPWFRGEPDHISTPLLPKVYRPKDNDSSHDENQLLQQFRMKAPSLGLMNTPPRSHTDEWLFLAQHVGLPTRLLDWTEGLFIALYFALLEDYPVVWMLDPIELNKLTTGKSKDNVFPLTWFSDIVSPTTRVDTFNLAQLQILGSEKFIEKNPKHYFNTGLQGNIGLANIRGAWENDRVGTKLPIAIRPTYVHVRMNTQKSCFTIQGKIKNNLSELVNPRIIKKYRIDKDYVQDFRTDMRIIGITHTSIFPDLDHLANELADIF